MEIIAEKILFMVLVIHLGSQSVSPLGYQLVIQANSARATKCLSAFVRKIV